MPDDLRDYGHSLPLPDTIGIFRASLNVCSAGGSGHYDGIQYARVASAAPIFAANCADATCFHGNIYENLLQERCRFSPFYGISPANNTAAVPIISSPAIIVMPVFLRAADAAAANTTAYAHDTH